MEDKNFFAKKYFMVSLMFAACLNLFSQDGKVKNEVNTSESPEVKKNYIIGTEGKKTVFYQTLSWENVEGILHFEFELEKK